VLENVVQDGTEKSKDTDNEESIQNVSYDPKDQWGRKAATMPAGCQHPLKSQLQYDQDTQRNLTACRGISPSRCRQFQDSIHHEQIRERPNELKKRE
jgi:hypothetical protein